MSIVLSCLFSLATCVAPNIRDWPESVPSQHIFIAAYADDEENQNLQSQTEYLQWTLSFYQGNLAYQSGWEDLEGYVIEAPSEEQNEILLAQLSELGVAIGSEWSKHNDIRLIDSRLLSLWGSTIQLAPDFEKQQETVEVIAQDVDSLLRGSLKKEEVRDVRYSRLLGIELFEGF